MPLSNGGQVTINVGANLQVLQSSVDGIQRVLDKLKPDSTRFKELSTVVAQIRRDMDRLQVQSSKPFGSTQQFKQTQGLVEKIGESFDRVGVIMDRLNFRDLNLSPEQLEGFNNLDKELQNIENSFAAAKDEVKKGLLSDADSVNFIKGIDANLVDKSLDEIIKRVDNKVQELNNKLYKSQQALLAAQSKLSGDGPDPTKILSGKLNKESLGGDLFNKFFQTTAKGQIRFNTTDFGKGEVKKQFLAALAAALDLSEKDFEPLVDMTYSEMEKAFQSMGSGDSKNLLKGAFSKTRAELAKAQQEQAALQKSYDQAKGVQGQIQTANARDEDGKATGELAKATDTYTQSLAANQKSREDLTNSIFQQALAEANLEISQGRVEQSTDGLTQSLNQASAAFLNNQRQIQTFNSIKNAIVNFMGFNQILNLTRNAVRAAINHIKELDTTMNGIAIVTDMTTADLWKQVDAYSSMAQNFGVTIQGAYEVSKIYYQAGYDTNDVLTLTNETLKLSKISGLDYATTTDYMMTA